MSTQGRIRLELNAATALLVLAGLSLAAMSCWAQLPEALQTARTVGGLNPTELMALVAILALGLCGYLIRLLFGRLLPVLDRLAQAQSDTSRLLAERPCIRRKEND